MVIEKKNKNMLAFEIDSINNKPDAQQIINTFIDDAKLSKNILKDLPEFLFYTKTKTSLFDYGNQDPVILNMATFGQDYVVFHTDKNIWQLCPNREGILSIVPLYNDVPKTLLCMVVDKSGVYLVYTSHIFQLTAQPYQALSSVHTKNNNEFISIAACKIADTTSILVLQNKTTKNYDLFHMGSMSRFVTFIDLDCPPRLVHNANYNNDDTFWVILSRQNSKRTLCQYKTFNDKPRITIGIQTGFSIDDIVLIYKDSKDTTHNFYRVLQDMVTPCAFSSSIPTNNTIVSYFIIAFKFKNGSMIDENTFYLNGATYTLNGTNTITKAPIGAICCIGDRAIYSLKNTLFDMRSTKVVLSRVVFPESRIHKFTESAMITGSIANKTDNREIKMKDLRPNMNSIFSFYGTQCVRRVMNGLTFVKDIEICTSVYPLDFLSDFRQMRMWDDGNLQIVENENIIWESNVHDSFYHAPKTYAIVNAQKNQFPKEDMVIVSPNGLYIAYYNRDVLSLRFNFINVPKTDILISKSSELIGLYRRMCWENMHENGLEFADSRCACLHDERLWTEALNDPYFSFIYDFMAKNNSNVQTLRDRFTCTLKQCKYTLGDDTIVNDYIINACKNNSIVICNNTVNIAENGKAYDNIVNVINNCGDLPKIDDQPKIDDPAKIDDIPQSNTNTIVLATCISLGIIVLIVACIYLYKNRRRISQYFSKSPEIQK